MQLITHVIIIIMHFVTWYLSYNNSKYVQATLFLQDLNFLMSALHFSMVRSGEYLVYMLNMYSVYTVHVKSVRCKQFQAE